MAWGKPEFNFFPTQSLILAFISPWYEHFKRTISVFLVSTEIGGCHCQHLLDLTSRQGYIHPYLALGQDKKKGNLKTYKTNLYFLCRSSRDPF